MTTTTKQTLSETLTARISEISKGDRDLVERDRRTFEQTCLHRHCKRVWQQLSSRERKTIRKSVQKETTMFSGTQCLEFLIEAHCIKQIEELILKSRSFSIAKQ